VLTPVVALLRVADWVLIALPEVKIFGVT